MSEELFNFELVTPEKVIVSGSVSSVSIAGVEGDMTIFANHSPICSSKFSNHNPGRMFFLSLPNCSAICSSR